MAPISPPPQNFISDSAPAIGMVILQETETARGPTVRILDPASSCLLRTTTFRLYRPRRPIPLSRSIAFLRGDLYSGITRSDTMKLCKHMVPVAGMILEVAERSSCTTTHLFGAATRRQINSHFSCNLRADLRCGGVIA